MALTRRFLETLLGKEQSDKIDEIIEKHSETVTALKAERDTAKEEAEKLAKLQEENDRLKKALKDNEDDPYKAQWEDLKKEYEDFKKGVEAEKTKAMKSDAYRKMLKEANVSEKRIESILKLCPVDSIEFDDKGEVKDKEKSMQYIKSEWKDFIETKGQEGAKPSDPPTNNRQGGDNQPSMARQMAERFYAARGIKVDNGGNGGEKK